MTTEVAVPWHSFDLSPYVEQAREELIETPWLRVVLVFVAAVMLLISLQRIMTLFTRK